jgi:hypothetical protein
MGRNKGICTLCGKGGPLSFEHVPPEGGHNVRGVIMHTLDDWLRRDSLDGPLPNGMPQPEGMGLIALCERCNRFLGREYVAGHSHLVMMGLHVLSELESRLVEFDARPQPTIVSVRFDEVERLACAKQIVSMALVTSGRGVVKAHPLLAEFVRNPTLTPLPSQYRLFLALAAAPAARTTGLFVSSRNIHEANHVVAAEIVYPPFAYALSFNAADVWPRGDITSWGSAAFAERAEIAIDLVLGFTHTAFPGDLRTRAMIEADRRENESQLANKQTR